MQVFWFIPTHGDSRYLGTAEGARQVDHTYLQQVAVAADTLGYEGVLIPTGRSCEDPWVVAASLIPVTKRLRFLVAVRPGLMAPTLAARMAATYDRLSNGRLLVNLVTGGDPAELAGDGLFLDHAQRYEASEEFTAATPSRLAPMPGSRSLPSARSDAALRGFFSGSSRSPNSFPSLAVRWKSFMPRLLGVSSCVRGQWLPEWPKPPAPRWLSSNCSTSSKCACTTGTSTNCAMRSPTAMVNGDSPRFQQDTISSPW